MCSRARERVGVLSSQTHTGHFSHRCCTLEIPSAESGHGTLVVAPSHSYHCSSRQYISRWDKISSRVEVLRRRVEQMVGPMQGLEGGTMSENANRATRSGTTQGENLSFVTDLWKRVHPGHFLTVEV